MQALNQTLTFGLLATSRPTNPDLPDLHERRFIPTIGVKGQVFRGGFRIAQPSPKQNLENTTAPTKNDLSHLVQSIAPTNHDL